MVLAGAFALSVVSLANAADRATESFMSDAIKGDLIKIELGQLAQQQGASQDVKNFGQMLVKDHSEHKGKAEALARQLGVTPPTSAGFAPNAEYLKLKLLSTGQFDREFARYRADDHMTDIDEYKKVAGRNGPTASFAKETLPTLEHHLQMAQSLQQKLAQQ